MIEKEKVGEWRSYKECNLSGTYYVQSINDNFKGLQINLYAEDEKSNVTIKFEDNVYAYRSIEESYNLKLINTLTAKYGDEFFMNNKTLYRVKNTDYIKEFCNSSLKIIEESQIFQFSIIAADYFIDIITDYEPEILIEYKN